MDDYTAAKVAALLGIDELELIAQSNAEREKDQDRKAFWEAKAKTAREKRDPLVTMKECIVNVNKNMETLKYLDAVKTKCKLKSDYQLAKYWTYMRQM